jgi:hypothetical protein
VKSKIKKVQERKEALEWCVGEARRILETERRMWKP